MLTLQLKNSDCHVISRFDERNTSSVEILLPKALPIVDANGLYDEKIILSLDDEFDAVTIQSEIRNRRIMLDQQKLRSAIID